MGTRKTKEGQAAGAAAVNGKRTDEQTTRARRTSHNRESYHESPKGLCATEPPEGKRAELGNCEAEGGLGFSKTDGLFNTQRNLRECLLNMQRNLHECFYCLFCFLSSDVFVSWEGRV